MDRAREIIAERMAKSSWDYDLIRRELDAVAATDGYTDAFEYAVRIKDYRGVPPLPHVPAKRRDMK